MTSDLASLILIAALFVGVVGIAVYAVFLRTLQGALERCAPQNRTVPAGQVWLSLIPLFNVVWQFILVSRIAESLRREFASRETAFPAPGDDYGKNLGTAMCALSLSSIVPFLGILTGLAGTVCWIVYWARIAGYSRALDGAGGRFEGGGAGRAEAQAPAPGSGWPVLVVLLMGIGATYLQRMAMSVAMPALRRDLELSNVQMGWVFSAFFVGLMAGYVLMTIVTALGGTRWGAFVSLAGASLAASACGLAQNVTGLIVARALLGVFMAGLLPAAIQAAREWCPSRMRPFAIGLALATGQVVAAGAPRLEAWLLLATGWRTVLLLTGLPSAAAAALCIFLWPARTPREPWRGVTGAGIASAAMLAAGLLLTAPVMWFLNNWLPLYANRRLAMGLSLPWMGMASTVFAAAGACGAVVAGACAWGMMSGGVSARRTRAALLTVCGAALPLVALAGYIYGWPLALLLMAVCSVAYQGWSTLLYSAVADTLPARGVAVGAAMGALMASVSGMLVPLAWGRLSTAGGDQAISLGVAGSAACALLVVALLAWLVRQEPETAG
jgi:MFS family permease